MPKLLIELEKEADILKAVDKQLSNVKEQIQEVIETKNQFITDFCTSLPMQLMSSRLLSQGTRRCLSGVTMQVGNMSL